MRDLWSKCPSCYGLSWKVSRYLSQLSQKNAGRLSHIRWYHDPSGPLACWDCGFESHWTWVPVSCECCVLSGRGLCVGLITRPEESNGMYYVWICSLSLDNNPLTNGPLGVVSPLGGITLTFFNTSMLTLYVKEIIEDQQCRFRSNRLDILYFVKYMPKRNGLVK